MIKECKYACAPEDKKRRRLENLYLRKLAQIVYELKKDTKIQESLAYHNLMLQESQVRRKLENACKHACILALLNFNQGILDYLTPESQVNME